MNCEYCNCSHNGKYGSKRFCSQKCARGYASRYDNKKELKESRCPKCKKKIKINKRASSATLCEKCKDYKCKKCGKKILKKNIWGFCLKCLRQDKDYRKRVSKSCKGKNGGYRKGGGRSKGGYYKGKYFDSQFEIEIVKFLESNNIDWIRNTKRFYYKWKRRQHYYVPDLFLPSTKQYLELKGYWWGDKENRTKLAVKTNNLNWILLMQSEWELSKENLLSRIG